MMHVERKLQYQLFLKYMWLKDIYPHPLKICDHIQQIHTTKPTVITIHFKTFK